MTILLSVSLKEILSQHQGGQTLNGGLEGRLWAELFGLGQVQVFAAPQDASQRYLRHPESLSGQNLRTSEARD